MCLRSCARSIFWWSIRAGSRSVWWRARPWLCGTPVLATASDGLPEIIDHQRNGWLVPFGDQQTLVEALAFLAERPEVRKTLAEVARKDVAERFALERYMNELKHLL